MNATYACGAGSWNLGRGSSAALIEQMERRTMLGLVSLNKDMFSTFSHGNNQGMWYYPNCLRQLPLRALPKEEVRAKVYIRRG